ncbi:MAG TPA: hypothetical protein VEH31_31170, partial [Streptosporangiaceae bacterium]|nr:hypothetical protein [Streptosporangiaceae bacterium]
MKRWLALGVGVLAALLLFPLLSPSRASASTLTDCLAQQHVCVASDGRALVSQSQEAQLERQIGGDPIYLVVAASGSSGYNSAMNQVISALNGHPQFTVGFLDSRLKHFGAYNKGMLPPHGAADIATSVVQQHQADQDIFAALTDFVTGVQREASSGSGSGSSPGPAGAAPSAPSHTLRNVLIVVGVIAVVAALGFFFIARPLRRRRQEELKEAKLAAQDDLIALSTRLTGQDTDVAIRANPEAAEEQAAALTAYERGTAALDAAKRVHDMGAVSRAIAEGQYHLACAEALAAGQPRPERRPSCFFDPRHGMSVTDAYWTPPDGGPGRSVPVCSACQHKLERGIEPEMRKVEAGGGRRVDYVNAGFAPAYWGGYGFGPGLFTGFLLGEILAPPVVYADGYSGGGDFGGGDFGAGDGGGDFGGGDIGGGDFGGG